MVDVTEGVRREMVAELNAEQHTREELEKQYGQVWSTDQLREEFDVTGFMAPFVVVTRRSDEVRGTMMFVHMPRFYFSFNPE